MWNTVAAGSAPPRPPIGCTRDLVRQGRSGAGMPRCRAARRLRALGRSRRPGRARLRPRRRLRAAARVARRPPRRRRRPRDRHERRPAGIRLLRRGAARRAARPRPRRGADLRPAAEDPRPARARRSSRSRWTRRGSTRRRSSASSARGRRASSTRSRPSRTRAGGRSRRSAGAASSSSCARARRARARGRSVRPRPLRGRAAAVAARARGRRPRHVRLLVLEDGRARACGSAGSSAPAALAARIEARAVSNYISPPFLTQATVFELIDRGAFEPNLERIRGLLRQRRDAMLEALERELAGTATLERAGGRLLPLGRPAGRRGRAARARGGRRRHVRQGRRLLLRAAAASRSARLAFSYASPSEIGEGVSTLASLLRA